MSISTYCDIPPKLSRKEAIMRTITISVIFLGLAASFAATANEMPATFENTHNVLLKEVIADFGDSVSLYMIDATNIATDGRLLPEATVEILGALAIPALNHVFFVTGFSYRFTIESGIEKRIGLRLENRHKWESTPTFPTDARVEHSVTDLTRHLRHKRRKFLQYDRLSILPTATEGGNLRWSAEYFRQRSILSDYPETAIVTDNGRKTTFKRHALE
jgi:hypothetical protein